MIFVLDLSDDHAVQHAQCRPSYIKRGIVNLTLEFRGVCVWGGVAGALYAGGPTRFPTIRRRVRYKWGGVLSTGRHDSSAFTSTRGRSEHEARQTPLSERPQTSPRSFFATLVVVAAVVVVVAVVVVALLPHPLADFFSSISCIPRHMNGFPVKCLPTATNRNRGLAAMGRPT